MQVSNYIYIAKGNYIIAYVHIIMNILLAICCNTFTKLIVRCGVKLMYVSYVSKEIISSIQ